MKIRIDLPGDVAAVLAAAARKAEADKAELRAAMTRAMRSGTLTAKRPPRRTRPLA